MQTAYTGECLVLAVCVFFFFFKKEPEYYFKKNPTLIDLRLLLSSFWNNNLLCLIEQKHISASPVDLHVKTHASSLLPEQTSCLPVQAEFSVSRSVTRCCGVNTSESLEMEAGGENKHGNMKGGGGGGRTYRLKSEPIFIYFILFFHNRHSPVLVQTLCR